MKKTAILILVVLQVVLLSFADGNAHSNLSKDAELLQKIIRDLSDESELLQKKIRDLSERQSQTKQELLDDAAKLKSIIRGLEEKSPRVPFIPKSSESILVTYEQKSYSHFVTGIKGGYYIEESDLPLLMIHSEICTDGAVYSGSLNLYYLLYGHINTLQPNEDCFQGFYQGTLSFVGYIH